jgi:PAS domain S-box-containing protein
MGDSLPGGPQVTITMLPASLRPNETESLLALEDLQVLDSAREADFQALVEVASIVCGVPISLISLIDRDRQFFKANTGLGELTETGRDISFCAHAVLGEGIFEVPDARLDQRFAGNPMVTGRTDVRFYAGAPIRVQGDIKVGTLCVVGREPGHLEPVQRQVLEKLALVAGRALETRAAWLKFNEQTQALAVRARDLRREAIGLHHVNGLLQETAEAFKEAQRLGHIGSWEMDFAEDPAYDITSWSDEMYRMTGREVGTVPPTLEQRLAAYLPDSREKLAAAIRECREHGTPYEMELQFVRVSDQAPRWLDSRGAAVRDPDGRIIGIRGTAHDITERKQVDAALRSSQEFLERTGRLAGVGGWEVDLVAGMVTWSPEVCRIHGAPEGYRPSLGEAIGFYAASCEDAA